MLPKFPAWYWLLPVLLLSAALAIVQLDADAIWFDEWITYFISGTGRFNGVPDVALGEAEWLQIPPLDTLYAAAIDNSWPPAFFLLLKLWDFVSGGHYLIDRTLALFIGLLAISVLYRFGKTLADHQTGLIAATLLGTSAFFIFYMHEIRGYTLYVLLPALAGWFYWLLQTPRYHYRRGYRWGFMLSIAGTLYAHYIGTAVVFGIGVYHVLFAYPRKPRKSEEDESLERIAHAAQRKIWANNLKLWINGCVFFSLWAAVLVISYFNESLTERSVDTATLLNGMIYGYSNNLWLLVIPALTLTLTHWREERVRFLWTWGLTILGVAMIGNIAADFLFHPRHIMGLLPAFMLAIAFALRQSLRWHPLIGYGLLGVWVGAGVVYAATPAFMNAIPRHIEAVPRAAMETMVSITEQCVQDDDFIVFGINTPPEAWVQDRTLQYYIAPYHERITHLGILVSDDVTNQSVLLPDDLQAAPFDERIAYISDDTVRIWLFNRPDLPLQQETLLFNDLVLEQGFMQCRTPLINRDDVLGVLYTRDGSATCPSIPLNCGS